MRICAALLLCAVWLSAFTSVATHPELALPAASGTLRLPAFYTGDPRHLPPSVEAVADANAPFAYQFRVDYYRDDMDVLALFNPLTLFGFPLGKVRVTAVATLTARSSGVEAKRYEATAIVSKTRTIYSSDSQTELRAQALAALRDNIEAQIQADAGVLRGFSSVAAPAAPTTAEVP